jgi:hypothetical protein
MKVKKVLIGASPSPMRKSIPDSIARRKTISLNVLDVLTIFPDRLPDAVPWIEQVVPTLMIGRPEEILHRFWSMDKNSWWEFDYGKKTLYLCSLEK